MSVWWGVGKQTSQSYTGRHEVVSRQGEERSHEGGTDREPHTGTTTCARVAAGKVQTERTHQRNRNKTAPVRQTLPQLQPTAETTKASLLRCASSHVTRHTSHVTRHIRTHATTPTKQPAAYTPRHATPRHVTPRHAKTKPTAQAVLQRTAMRHLDKVRAMRRRYQNVMARWFALRDCLAWRQTLAHPRNARKVVV